MTTDDVTTVSMLREAVSRFVDAREWRPFHSPKNLAMSIAIEAAELMEHFQWLTPEQAVSVSAEQAQRAAIAGELSDVLIYCLSLGNALELDLSSAILSKLATNEQRYPAEAFRGRFRRPERARQGGEA